MSARIMLAHSANTAVNQCDVVIVNYNAGHLLTECIVSAFCAGISKIVVVDNASIDDSLKILQAHFQDTSRLQIIRNSSNLGFATACNIGARQCVASNILFLNPDSTLAPDALTHMLRVLHSSEQIGMVGGFLCNPDGSEQAGGRRVFPTPRRAFMRAFGLSRLSKFAPALFSDFLMHQEPVPEQPIAVEAISGACMLVKRSAIESVGLWDEAYFLHCEDLDWCMRFKHKGWLVMFVPNARILHKHGWCSRSRPYFVEWHKHHGMLRFYKKFFRSQYPAPVWAGVVVAVWFRFSLIVTHIAALKLRDSIKKRRHA
jgi:GT2 family glycosyltransferase